MEWVLIPLLVSIAIAPYINEFVCNWRKNLTIYYRVVIRGTSKGLANVDVDVAGLGTYHTDDQGKFKIIVLSNRSKMPLVTCPVCSPQQQYGYIISYQHQETKDSTLIDITQKEDTTIRVLYVP